MWFSTLVFPITVALVNALATQHVASEVMFFGTNIVFLDLAGVGYALEKQQPMH